MRVQIPQHHVGLAVLVFHLLFEMLRSLCRRTTGIVRAGSSARVQLGRWNSTMPSPEAIIDESQALRASVQALNDVSFATQQVTPA
jgi:hypothetical protein